MSVLHENSQRRQHAIVNMPCFVGTSVLLLLLLGPLISDGCNVTLHAQREPLNFTSPYYPGTYRNHDNCFWDIYPETRGYRVVLEMVYSNIESSTSCEYDVLTINVINNGNQSEADSYRICGETRWNILIQEDQHFHAVFKTDSTGTRSGFLIRYYEKNGTGNCGVPLVATSVGKTFTSPGYPNTYFLSQTCTWTITTEHQNQTIQLDTMDSVLQNVSSRGTCNTDYVTVFNGQYGSSQLGTFCANQRPVVNSGGNSLEVRLRTDSSRNYKGFKMLYKAMPATTCNVSLLAGYSPMVIVSPGYPNNYFNDMYCTWTISAPVGYKVKVEVQTISMEVDTSCSKDYVLFTDGSTAYATQLGKYCSDVTGYIVSSRNAMTITFSTNSYVTDKGFSLKYIAWKKGCGEDDTISYGTKYIESPDYPLFYPDNADCEWTISTSIDGYVIHVAVVYFNIEHDSTCSYDYVQLYDVTTFESSIGRWCGRDGPNTQTTGQTMKVKFHSDGSTSLTGFKLSFTAGEPTSDFAASMNIGAILGGVFGGITAVGIATCCYCGLCSRKKSSPNGQQQRNRSYEGTVSFINIPSNLQTTPAPPTAPAVLRFMSPPPPSYNDVVKDDPPPYCQAVQISDMQPVVMSSPSCASQYQGIDNPAGPI